MFNRRIEQRLSFVNLSSERGGRQQGTVEPTTTKTRDRLRRCHVVREQFNGIVIESLHQSIFFCERSSSSNSISDMDPENLPIWFPLNSRVSLYRSLCLNDQPFRSFSMVIALNNAIESSCGKHEINKLCMHSLLTSEVKNEHPNMLSSGVA